MKTIDLKRRKGSAVSKISSTLAELRAMNEARNRRRREVRQYLSSASLSPGDFRGDFWGGIGKIWINMDRMSY